MPENDLQLFQFQRWGYAEQAFAVKAAVRDQNVAVGVETENIAEGLDGDDGAGERALFRNRILQEDFQGLLDTAVQIEQQMSIIENMRPDEGTALARCFYRVYGYSFREFLYYPAKVCELLESGLQISLAAVTPAGEIVAHQALVLERPESRIAEMGQGVVDPRTRSRGLFEKIKIDSIACARQSGLYGLYTETVTIHPYSQKANFTVGDKEIGFLFGMASQMFSFKMIAEKQDQRQTTIMLYHRTNDEPLRTVYPPVQHEGIIRRIYENGSFNRQLAGATGENTSEPGPTAIVNVRTLSE